MKSLSRETKEPALTQRAVHNNCRNVMREASSSVYSALSPNFFHNLAPSQYLLLSAHQEEGLGSISG